MVHSAGAVRRRGRERGTLKRPALERLLERTEERQIDRVVIYRLDRITRSLLDWVKLAEAFERHRVGLSIITGDSLDGAGRAMDHLVLNMLATFAEFERGLIRERLRDARAAKRQRGLRSAGLVPFGFTTAPTTHQLEPLPAERELVRQIFERAAAGSTPVEIALWLNGQGFITKRSGKVGGKPWTARAVLRLLENRVYLGEIGGTRAAHGPVVDADLFARANSAIDARRTRVPGRRDVEEDRDPFLLRGLLRCTRCGRLMTTASGKAKTRRSKPPRFYRCRGIDACRGTQVAAGAIEQRVLRWLQAPPRRGELGAEAAFVLGQFKAIWRVLLPRTTRSLVQQLVWEVRWDARRDRFELMLDDIAIHQQAEELRRVDEQGAG